MSTPECAVSRTVERGRYGSNSEGFGGLLWEVSTTVVWLEALGCRLLASRS